MQIASPRGAAPSATGDDVVDHNPRPSLQSRLRTGVVIVEVSRNPNSLHQALEAATQLQQLHSSLSEAGYDPNLPSGATVFVCVDQYRIVKMVAENMYLKRRHFVISEDVEKVVESIISSLPGKEKVRIKSRERISGLSLYTKEQDILAEVNRTFITVGVPGSSSMRSRPRGTATCSTTDAHHQRGRNPRRA